MVFIQSLKWPLPMAVPLVLIQMGLLIALLVTQIVAFPFALIFGRLSKNTQQINLLKYVLLPIPVLPYLPIQLDKQWEFGS